jgi:tetratricopeptide (TPR) repeat protein
MTVTLTFLFLAQAFTPEVIEHAQAGAEALKQGHFETAIQEFRYVTAQQPDSASGHANLGEAYFQNHEYETAIPELQRALQLNPQMMGTHQTLGVALLVEGDPAQALPHLEKNRTPELLGLAYLETGRLGSAIMALQAALERQPGDPDLLYYFGRATGLAARRTFDQLARDQPEKTSPDAAPRQETATDAGHDPVKEVIRLQTALAQRPNDPELLFEFHQVAETASRQAFDKIAAGSARSHQVAAERLAASGRPDEAEREYAAAVRMTPYASGMHLALGNVLAAEGKWTGAVAQYRAETALRPLSVETMYRLGYALLEQGQARDAEKTLRRADELRPNTPETLLALGRAMFAADDAAGAEKSWMKLLEIDRSGEFAAQAHLGLATLYRRAGKSPEAEREMAAYQQLEDQRKH